MLKLLMIICSLLLGTIAILAVVVAEFWRSKYAEEVKKHGRE